MDLTTMMLGLVNTTLEDEKGEVKETPVPIILPNQFKEFHDAEKLFKYFSPILLFVGIIFNGMSFAVYSRKNFRSSVTGLFFRALAVADALSLCASIWPPWLRRMGAKNYNAGSMTSCKVWMWFFYTATNYPAWVLVCVTVERFIGIMIPHKAKTIMTKKVAIGMLLTILAVILLLLVPIIPATIRHVVQDAKGNVVLQVCVMFTIGGALDYWLSEVWTVLNFLLLCGAPFCLLLVLNLCIISRLVVASQRRRQMSGESNDSKLTQMTTVLLTVSFTFLVLMFPIALYSIADMTWLRLDKIAKYPHTQAKKYLWFVVALNMQWLNSTVNFILYCISGPRFRREVAAMFCFGKLAGNATSSVMTASTVVTKDATSKSVVDEKDVKPEVKD